MDNSGPEAPDRDKVRYNHWAARTSFHLGRMFSKKEELLCTAIVSTQHGTRHSFCFYIVYVVLVGILTLYCPQLTWPLPVTHRESEDFGLLLLQQEQAVNPRFTPRLPSPPLPPVSYKAYLTEPAPWHASKKRFVWRSAVRAALAKEAETLTYLHSISSTNRHPNFSRYLCEVAKHRMSLPT